jgi:hypothetical protein
MPYAAKVEAFPSKNDSWICRLCHQLYLFKKLLNFDVLSNIFSTTVSSYFALKRKDQLILLGSLKNWKKEERKKLPLQFPLKWRQKIKQQEKS